MADTDTGTFGELLKRYRLIAGLSQEELADRAGLSARGISDLERGIRRTPQRETVRLLAEALGLSEREREQLDSAVERRGKPVTSLKPSVASPSPRHNLPVHLTSFIGREKVIEEVRGILLGPHVRLLTLTGPGGTGKTRLVLRVAGECLGSFPDGVWFADISPITDPGLVISAVAQALGVREVGGQPLIESIGTYLRDRRLLLVLDNFEHLLEAAPLVAELLGSSPGLKVLATSRAALRLSAEHLYLVPPLGLPDSVRLPGVESLSGYEAVLLFAERARAARPGFRVTDENAQAVAGICVRLDGLPLAIELASARLRLFAPEAMLSRLGSALSLLSGGPRDAPARQRTLRAAIDWSYELLSEDERTLFRRLSVFAGGFTLEAAEAVCGPDDELDVLGGVESLLDNSLLRRLGGEVSEPRFGMLETVREYALERMEDSGESDQLLQRHAQYFLELAERSETQLRVTNPVVWMARLEAEHSNIQVALGWLLQQETGPAVRLAAALGEFWNISGRLSEGRRWLEEMLRRCTSASGSVRARATYRAGWIALQQDDLQSGIHLLQDALKIFREGNDLGGMAYCLIALGRAEQLLGETAKDREHCEEGLRLFRQLEDRRGIAEALELLSYAVEDLGEAQRLLEESVSTFRLLGDDVGLARSLHALGMVAMVRGDHGRAKILVGESLEWWRILRNDLDVARSLRRLAWIALIEGDFQSALDYAEDGLTLYRRMKYPRGISICQLILGWALYRQGDVGRAVGFFKDSLDTYATRGWNVLSAIEGIAVITAMNGDAGAAATMFGACEALRKGKAILVHPGQACLYEDTMDALRCNMADDAFAAARDAGQSLSLEETIRYTLQAAERSVNKTVQMKQ
ncbi:MAG: tetratricopeptide repeat protein [Chloroflexota bacterium]|nr:tetratricopeptide repeat protein [Chloroflexota bacterium]